MREYKFYDTDPMGLGWEEYDIVGKDYVDLIKTCCQYSKTLSFRIVNAEIRYTKDLEVYRIPKNKNINFMSPAYWINGKLDEIRYYQICPELCELLSQSVKSIYQWRYISPESYTNPEDPTFYREDGSVFFTSVIHDGVCILTPREDENVDHIVKKEHWIKTK